MLVVPVACGASARKVAPPPNTTDGIDRERLEGTDMNEGPANQGGMVDMNDSLEAVSVFRNWKNIFFVVLLVCLVLTQVAFWLVNLNLVGAPAAPDPAGSTPGAAAAVSGTTANEAAPGGAFLGILDFARLARAVELINGIMVVVGALLAASIFFALMVSLVGRLGGLSHISRAFILSLIAVVLLVPWQILGVSVLGVSWTPEELVRWLPVKNNSLVDTITFYFRFTAYWLAVVVLVILSQARTTRWSKAILRRLEII